MLKRCGVLLFEQLARKRYALLGHSDEPSRLPFFVLISWESGNSEELFGTSARRTFALLRGFL